MEEKQWYVVNTYAGHENRVKENLEKRVETMGISDSLFRIVVAEETEIEYKNGKPVEKSHNLFPGYLFVEMIMTDEAWYVVRNTPGVTGFVGSSGGGAKPFPVTREQIEPVLKRMGMVDEDMYSNYQVGDLVRILTGSFEGVEGNIEEIDQEAGEVVLNTIFFGRMNRITVKFSEVEKI